MIARLSVVEQGIDSNARASEVTKLRRKWHNKELRDLFFFIKYYSFYRVRKYEIDSAYDKYWGEQKYLHSSGEETWRREKTGKT